MRSPPPVTLRRENLRQVIFMKNSLFHLRNLLRDAIIAGI